MRWILLFIWIVIWITFLVSYVLFLGDVQFQFFLIGTAFLLFVCHVLIILIYGSYLKYLFPNTPKSKTILTVPSHFFH